MIAKILFAPVALLYVALVLLDRSKRARKGALVSVALVLGLLAWVLLR